MPCSECGASWPDVRVLRVPNGAGGRRRPVCPQCDYDLWLPIRWRRYMLRRVDLRMAS